MMSNDVRVALGFGVDSRMEGSRLRQRIRPPLEAEGEEKDECHVARRMRVGGRRF